MFWRLVCTSPTTVAETAALVGLFADLQAAVVVVRDGEVLSAPGQEQRPGEEGGAPPGGPARLPRGSCLDCHMVQNPRLTVSQKLRLGGTGSRRCSVRRAVPKLLTFGVEPGVYASTSQGLRH